MCGHITNFVHTLVAITSQQFCCGQQIFLYSLLKGYNIRTLYKARGRRPYDCLNYAPQAVLSFGFPAGFGQVEKRVRTTGGGASGTVRNLRIREDTPKYLLNLDPNSAHYDPKSRSMREDPNPDKVRESMHACRRMYATHELCGCSHGAGMP